MKNKWTWFLAIAFIAIFCVIGLNGPFSCCDSHLGDKIRGDSWYIYAFGWRPWQPVAVGILLAVALVFKDVALQPEKARFVNTLSFVMLLCILLAWIAYLLWGGSKFVLYF